MPVSDELLPKVYEELRQLAASKMARERGDHTLQATALVHEAWLKVNAQRKDHWQRTEFYLAAAEAMRRILIDRARGKNRQKRGSGIVHEELFESQVENAAPEEQLLAVDAALEQLALEEPRAADLVKLKYFAGFTMQETAEALGIAERTAHRLWSFARAWLRREIEKDLAE